MSDLHINEVVGSTKLPVMVNVYDVCTSIKIPNQDQPITIDPNCAYTVVYNNPSVGHRQISGYIRSLREDPNKIVVITQQSEDVNWTALIPIIQIEKISLYTFGSRFEQFNNWVGVETKETNILSLRVRYVEGESITDILVGNKYTVEYVSQENGSPLGLRSICGVVTDISRVVSREFMKDHVDHFTNSYDYNIVFVDSATGISTSINVHDIRNIDKYEEPAYVDKSELENLIKAEYDKTLYTHKSYDRYQNAIVEATKIFLKDDATLDDVTYAITAISDAVNNLCLLSDEKEFVFFDEDANTLFCSESPYPVIVRGIGDSLKVEHYTNFGSRRCFTIPKNVDICWSRCDADAEYIMTELHSNIKYDNTVGEDLSIYDADLYIESGEIHNIYLGMMNYLFRQDELMCGLTILKSTVNDIYCGGISSPILHSIANKYSLVECNVNIKDGTTVSNIYMGANEGLDRNQKACDTVFLNITSGSSVENLYCGGVSGLTNKSIIDLHPDSTINTLYMTGSTAYVLVRDAYVILKGSVEKIYTIARSCTAGSHQCISVHENANIEDIVIGGEEGWACNISDSTKVTISPVDKAHIGRVTRGEANGVDYPGEIIINLPTIDSCMEETEDTV